MSIDPALIRAERHTEIGHLLQRHVDSILERWSERAVEEQPQAKRVHHAVLLDHLRDFLWRLGRSLAESDEVQASQHCLPAIAHGEQRWEAGWSLLEVVRDFQILRLVILECLEEALDRPLKFREVLATGLALDEAIAASVVMYVKGREEHQRQLEKRRAEEQRQVEQRLQEQTAALRNADRLKNEFLAMLGHELRNPLAPIRHAVHIFQMKGSPDPDLQWAQGVIERQVELMTRMVEDLLDVSRITRGKLVLQKEQVDAASVVARAVETTRPLIDARRHALTVTLPPESVWVEADPLRLAQVLANLLTNATKYTDDGGRIDVTVAQQDGHAVFTVRDTGIGISAELLPHVFEAFMQESRSVERAQGGLGIGLALVRHLVELHGGTVEASSAGPGKGSAFAVRLPLTTPAPAPAAKPAPEQASAGATASRRILVVDDNVDNANGLALLLRLLGHSVEAVHDGPAALTAAKEHAPEIVLLDIGLPGLDGLEVARRLRQEVGLMDALLVALTGYGQDEDRQRSQAAGFNVHLVKPVDLDLLQALLAHPKLASAPRRRDETPR